MVDIAICNQALTRYCGVDRINSLGDGTPAAIQCAEHYDGAVQFLLEAHPWTWARARRALALLVNDRPDEWAYRYSMPAEALSIRWVNHPDLARFAIRQRRSPDAPRETASGDIYSDAPNAVAEMTVAIDDESRFPQAFRDALAAQLATRIVRPLTESSSRAQMAEQAAMRLLDTAMVLDARNEATRSLNQVPDFMAERGISELDT